MFRATVFKVAGALVMSAGLFTPPAAMAQDTDQGTEMLRVELNDLVDDGAGNCQLVMVATNGLPQDLSQVAWQVAVFDQDGRVTSLLALDFGAMISSKNKVVGFTIPNGGCDTIGRVIINDIAACTAEDDSDMRDTCLRALETQNRSDIEFGI